MNKYNEIMARVTVSEETKERILNELQAAPAPQAKVVRFPNIKRYIALAACFALVIVGVLIATRPEPPQVGGDLTGGAPVEYESAKALSKACGIKIKDLENLPFAATQITYLDYGVNLAEICYSNGEESLYYRVSIGSGDNSGDYNEYDRVETVKTGGLTLTLKGSGDLVYCVLYETHGRSYSISSTAGLTTEQIEAMIA